MVYTGTDRQHDKMDKEKANKEAYLSFERDYIFKNMRPSNVTIWEWRVMWDMVPYRDTPKEAMQDAKALAKTTGMSVKVGGSSPPYKAFLCDSYDWVEGHLCAESCAVKKLNFMKQLVVDNMYPDLAAIAKETESLHEHSKIWRHSLEIQKKHQQWKAEASNIPKKSY